MSWIESDQSAALVTGAAETIASGVSPLYIEQLQELRESTAMKSMVGVGFPHRLVGLAGVFATLGLTAPVQGQSEQAVAQAGPAHD